MRPELKIQFQRWTLGYNHYRGLKLDELYISSGETCLPGKAKELILQEMI
ncbi:MAG TPA: hypothetical protein PLE33_03430 [Candidatus Cloacimonas sp.]|nr:hypothetical protein [Candidatus Cloacimonas sp.]HPS60299.1 hypothetical protein [Candidatus Cloacimonas sp.]